MSNLLDYAESELKLINMGKDSKGIDKLMHDNIIEIIKKFSEQGHSGFSAGYAISMLTKLMNYEPLTPLTGEDDEWLDVSEYSGEPCWQNKRCYSVFKDKNGNAYNSEGIIFYPKGERDMTYTGTGSRVSITFPYVPTREYVEVDE